MLNINLKNYTVEPDNLLSDYKALAVRNKNRGRLEYEYVLIKFDVNENNIVRWLKVDNYGDFDIVEYDECVTVDDACSLAENDVYLLADWELNVKGEAIK